MPQSVTNIVRKITISWSRLTLLSSKFTEISLNEYIAQNDLQIIFEDDGSPLDGEATINLKSATSSEPVHNQNPLHSIKELDLSFAKPNQVEPTTVLPRVVNMTQKFIKGYRDLLNLHEEYEDQQRQLEGQKDEFNRLLYVTNDKDQRADYVGKIRSISIKIVQLDNKMREIQAKVDEFWEKKK